MNKTYFRSWKPSDSKERQNPDSATPLELLTTQRNESEEQKTKKGSGCHLESLISPSRNSS